MAAQNANQKYDRDFLLSPEKRNQIVELWEVEKYGRDCFNDPNHVHLYGMPPKEWYERGVRILKHGLTGLVSGERKGGEPPLENRHIGNQGHRHVRSFVAGSHSKTDGSLSIFVGGTAR